MAFSRFLICVVVNPPESLTLFFGAMFTWFWERRNAESCTSVFIIKLIQLLILIPSADYMTALASGLVAGSGLMGVICAVFALTNVPTLVNENAGS